MKIETLYKYLLFLKKECERHSKDGEITEDEINQLNLEIKKFKNTINESCNISLNIKEEINKIDFDLDEENHNKSKHNWLNFIGSWYATKYREQENRKNRLEKLSIDLENLIFQLKLIS